MTKARELADLAGSSGGGIDVEADRLNQVIQSIEGAEGFDWSAGMAFDVVDTVPSDSDGDVGDVVFVTQPGALSESEAKTPALTLLRKQTFTAGYNQVNNVFSTDYDNYRILMTIDTLAANAPQQIVWWRLNQDGTDYQANSWNSATSYVATNTSTPNPTENYNDFQSSQTSGIMFQAIGNSLGTAEGYNGAFGDFTLANPMRPFAKRLVGTYYAMQEGTSEFYYTVGSGMSTKQTFNGFTFGTQQSSDFSGTLYIYGYSKGA